MSDVEKLNHGSPYTTYPGVAAKDIERDSMTLYIISPELNPHATTSDLAPGKTTGSVQATNRDGTPVHTNVTVANYIEATWDGGDFLRYPPMIRKGEPVEIFKRLDQDGWRWRSTPYGRMGRKTDRLCLEISAIGTNTEPSKTDTATYSLEMNSIDQKITLRTSAANGEASPFRFCADLKKGQWYGTDSLDENGGDDKTANRVFMDTGRVTKAPTYQVNLNTGVGIKLFKKDMFITVPGKLYFDVKDRAIFQSPLTIINAEKAGVVIASVSNLALTATKDVVANISGVFGMNVSSAKFSGTLIANGIRSVSFVYGLVNGLYKAVTIGRPDEGDPTDPGNGADTDTSGSGDQAAISARSVIDFAGKVSSYFAKVTAKTGAPGPTEDLVPTVKSGTMSSHKGKED